MATSRQLLEDNDLHTLGIIERHDDTSFDAMACWRTQSIRFDSGMRQQTPRMQRFFAAHEVAHFVLGHANRRTFLVGLSALMTILIGSTTAAFLLGLSTLGFMHATHLAGLIASTEFVVLWVVAARRSRVLEAAADAWAVQQVGPLSDHDRSEQLEHERLRLTWGRWLPRWLSTHPHWRDRGHPAGPRAG